MDNDMKFFKNDVDAWIKQIRNEVSQLRDIPYILEESNNNIEHNYELVQELRKEVEDLKQELKLMKVMQLMIMKNKVMQS
jgi:dsDNA-specific endonuclease/ATPase MutS2